MSENIPGDPQTSAPIDYSVPQRIKGPARTIYAGDFIYARVNGQNLVLTTQEYDQLIRDGQDVEVRTPGTGSST